MSNKTGLIHEGHQFQMLIWVSLYVIKPRWFRASGVAFNPELHQSKTAVEGPSTSISTLSPNRAVKLQETPPDPRVISDHKFISLESCRSPKAKLESQMAYQHCCRPQVRQTNPKHSSPIQKPRIIPHSEMLATLQSGFYSTDNDEKQKMTSGIRLPAEYRPN